VDLQQSAVAHTMSTLDGKTALITGGTSGIGLATAQLFEREGARVVVTGRREEVVRAYNAAASANSFAVLADAAVPSDNAKLMDAVVRRLGSLDILFLNAGIGKPSAFAVTSEQLYDLQWDVMVRGPFFTAQAALQHFNPGASIVFNSSVANIKGTPDLSVYNATKAAVRSLVRTLAAELAVKQIRVNAVSPGLIETPIWEKMGATPEQVEQAKRSKTADVPLGRIGTVEDVAQAVLFLSSSSSSYITGIELPVDGGWTQV
jgi:NAD(P)-dependent dehydrogenase (short-subunit alcohol dehydrogenase family)